MNIEIITLVIAGFAAVLSLISIVIASILAIKSWHMSRVIYSLEEHVLRRFNGSQDDSGDRGLTAINNKLKTGKFVIESIQERIDGDWAVLISQIKK